MTPLRKLVIHNTEIAEPCTDREQIRQRQVDGELHHGTGAVRADVLHALAHLVQQRAHAIEDRSIAADEGDQLALFQEERRLAYVGITRAQRSLTITWCKKRKRARDSMPCEVSRFIKEMKLDEGDALPEESEQLTPQNRLANLKALLQKPKAA